MGISDIESLNKEVNTIKQCSMHDGFHAWTQTESPSGRQLLEVNARIHATDILEPVHANRKYQTNY